jgi:hypothetical protein
MRATAPDHKPTDIGAVTDRAATRGTASNKVC